MGHARLADFGLAEFGETSKELMATATNKAGTIRWMAPEDHERFGLTFFVRTRASDVYAFGYTCLEAKCII